MKNKNIDDSFDENGGDDVAKESEVYDPKLNQLELINGNII